MIHMLHGRVVDSLGIYEIAQSYIHPVLRKDIRNNNLKR